MMNYLFNVIVFAALIGTFLLAPTPQPLPPSVASRPAETAIVSSVIDSAAAKAAIEACGYGEVSLLTKAADGTWRAKAVVGTAEVKLTVDAQGRVLPD
jgi:hypothetical protein